MEQNESTQPPAPLAFSEASKIISGQADALEKILLESKLLNEQLTSPEDIENMRFFARVVMKEYIEWKRTTAQILKLMPPDAPFTITVYKELLLDDEEALPSGNLDKPPFDLEFFERSE